MNIYALSNMSSKFIKQNVEGYKDLEIQSRSFFKLAPLIHAKSQKIIIEDLSNQMNKVYYFLVNISVQLDEF